MSLSNKELLDKIKDEVWNHAYPFGNGEWKSGRNDDLWPIVCERFATEKAKELFTRSEVESCIKDSLEAAADNAKVSPGGPSFSVDKSSITDTKNIKIK